MKLHPANFAHQYFFTGYGERYVLVNQIRYEKNLIVLPDHLIEDWPVVSIAELEFHHFDPLVTFMPEIILLGTGSKHIFPKQSLLSQVTKLGIGIEIMDSYAACRTFNILAEEGRQIAAALLV
ncbi:Mth938-like domain-containing protein [Nitrosomonas sp.]|uniref:Mth938-like domain-containing protein n=1 Tax=Nitrosomonas sp. TaxID=42353 RepID=UPI001DE68A35|nr:Mth938-like domain-containing protein [Nitrosomonas sp.]MBX3618145.1 Mth938-like domain-containing protein [Nitrosomonas sp.]